MSLESKKQNWPEAKQVIEVDKKTKKANKVLVRVLGTGLGFLDSKIE